MVEYAVGLALPKTDDRPRTVVGGTIEELGSRVETLGYESLWTSEGWGNHAFVHLTRLAVETETIELGTSIVNVFSRSPAVLAMAGASMQEVSDHRFRLGIGTSHPNTVERLHGLSFERPVRRVHETIELVNRYTGTGRFVDYEGELFSVSEVRPLSEDVPVYNAAMGSANLRATGRLADGWIPHNLPFSELEPSFEYIKEAADDADRSLAEFSVMPWVPAVASRDGDRARDRIRSHIAFYVGHSEAYERAVAKRFPTRAKRIARTWDEGDCDAAVGLVTDAMINILGIAGTPEAAREQVTSLLANPVVDVPILVVPYGTAPELVKETIEALAPRL